jgi:hypothetical protein
MVDGHRSFSFSGHFSKQSFSSSSVPCAGFYCASLNFHRSPSCYMDKCGIVLMEARRKTMGEPANVKARCGTIDCQHGGISVQSFYSHFFITWPSYNNNNNKHHGNYNNEHHDTEQDHFQGYCFPARKRCNNGQRYDLPHQRRTNTKPSPR